MHYLEENCSLSFWLEAFLHFRQSRISRSFYQSTSLVLRKWQTEIAIPTLEELTAATMQRWFDSKASQIKMASAASYLDWIRLFLDWCVSKEVLPANPALEVAVPPVAKPFRKRFVSACAVRKLLANCPDSELKYCLFCGFHAGLRLGEVIMSRPEWFDLESGLLHVIRSAEFETKDKEDRTVPLTEEFARFLRSTYGLRGPYMIAPQAHGHPYRFSFRKRFLSYCHSQGTDITFHDTRRTFASLHVSAGTSIYKVAKWLGNSVQVVERHYGHLAPADPEINRAFSP